MIIDALNRPPRRQQSVYLRHMFRKDMIELNTINDLVYFRNRPHIPDFDDLRLQVVHRTHSLGPAEHPSCVKTLDLLQWTYLRPKMSIFVVDLVKRCALCFRTQSPRTSPPSLIKTLEVPVKLWADISIDYIVELPA